MIDTIHNTGLRLVTGAFRSSPIPSVLNTADSISGESIAPYYWQPDAPKITSR